jgi:predicted transcriptional regulator
MTKPTVTPLTRINFEKVERLRKVMLLSASDVAKVFGVTRMTYYSWVRGAPMRASREMYVREQLRAMLEVADGEWRNIAATVEPSARVDKLLALLNSTR